MSTSPPRVRTPAYSSEATARPLPEVTPVSPPAGEPRTPLSVVPAPLRSTPKWFITFCVGLLLSALLLVLVVNITVSNRQYELVGLRADQAELTQTNESLSQQVAHRSAPQNVASEAASMGMVLPGDTASIELESGEVTGNATVASEDNKPTGFVGEPTVKSGQGTPAEASAEEASGAAENESGGVEAPAQEATTEAKTTDDTGSNAASGSSSEADLNGGTLQAPQMSSLGG